jgi:GINS complex subunit 4
VETETGNLDPTSNFRLILIQTELERVKYLVRAYLRIRMHKVRLPPAARAKPPTN